MSFADHLNATKRTGGTPLLVSKHLAAMPADEAEAASNLLASELSARHVAEVFCSEGYAVSESAVANWRAAKAAGRVS